KQSTAVGRQWTDSPSRPERLHLAPEPVLSPLQAPGRGHAGAVPDARKKRLTGRKPRQETAARPPYHSPRAGRPGAVAPSAQAEAPASGFDVSQWDDREKESRACPIRTSLRSARRHGHKGRQGGRDDPRVALAS